MLIWTQTAFCIYQLPRNVGTADFQELAATFRNFCQQGNSTNSSTNQSKWHVEHENNFLNRKLKMVTGYFKRSFEPLL